MRTKQREIVAAIIQTTDKKILLGKVRDGGVYPNCWHIPGGGVEANETLMEALQREVKEEVGISLSKSSIRLVSDTETGEAIKHDKVTGEPFEVQMHFHTYLIELPWSSTDITLSLDDDLREARWVDISDLKMYTHTPPSQKHFQLLGWI